MAHSHSTSTGLVTGGISADSRQETWQVDPTIAPIEMPTATETAPEDVQSAASLLLEARANIYHWPESFPGFTAELTVVADEGVWSGKLDAASSRSYTLDLPDCPVIDPVRWHIEEIVSHRESPAVSRMASPPNVTLGDNHPLWGRKILFAGEKMRSWYHILDGRITTISRAFGTERFVIRITKHWDFDGKCAAHTYTANYYNEENGRLVKVETYLDEYEEVAGFRLPARRVFTEVTDSAEAARELIFSELALRKS